MKFISLKYWINENISEKVTVLYPGSFKPMHKGHVELIERYVDNPEVKEIIVFIGPGVRNGITQEEAYEIANMLIGGLYKVSIEAVKYPSPVLTAYKYMKNALPGIYTMAAAKKGEDDEDYKRVIKFEKDFQPDGKYYSTLPKGVTVINLPENVEPIYYKGRTDEYDGEPISASILRQDILNDDYNNFKTNYPELDEEIIQKIWDMTQMVITEIDETEYNDKINE